MLLQVVFIPNKLISDIAKSYIPMVSTIFIDILYIFH